MDECNSFREKVKEPYNDIVLFGGVDYLFTLPKEIGINDHKIISVYIDQLQFSPSKKYLSSVVSPTASWSMDSNMFAVLSSDGTSIIDQHRELWRANIDGTQAEKWLEKVDMIEFWEP